jgi:DNA-binding NarL/FixJ family response regulator
VVGGSPLLRQALAALLARVGFVVTDGPEADVVLVAEGRDRSLEELIACPQPLVVVSAEPDAAVAVELLEERPEGTAYLAASRIPDGRVLAAALRAVAAGHSLLDVGVADGLLGRDPAGAFSELTPRERQILSLIAEGRSNQAICDHLVLSPKTIETHVSRIFCKLGLPSDDTRNRRVVAVLRYLQGRAPVAAAA